MALWASCVLQASNPSIIEREIINLISEVIRKKNLVLSRQKTKHATKKKSLLETPRKCITIILLKFYQVSKAKCINKCLKLAALLADEKKKKKKLSVLVVTS